MLDRRFIKTQRPSVSLDHKNLGPCPIKRIINDHSYELTLPESMRIYPIFHPWLLHLHQANPLHGQAQEEPGPILIEKAEEDLQWYVDEVVDSRINKRSKDPHTGKRGLLEYKATYPGYALWNTNPAWQPFSDFTDCPNLIADFHHQHATKDGPHSLFKYPDDWTPSNDVTAILT